MKEEYRVTLYDGFGRVQDMFDIEEPPRYYKWGGLALKDGSILNMPFMIAESKKGINPEPYLNFPEPVSHLVQAIALDGTVIRGWKVIETPTVLGSHCELYAIKPRFRIMIFGPYTVKPIEGE